MHSILSARHIKYDTIYQKMQKLNYIATVLFLLFATVFLNQYNKHMQD